MACPNFKKGLKMAFGPLGVKDILMSGLETLLRFWTNTCILHFLYHDESIHNHAMLLLTHFQSTVASWHF
jgi:hypothetical protein